MVNQYYISSHLPLPNKCELKGMATSRAERTSQKLLCQMSDLRRRWLERSLTFRSLVHTCSYHKPGTEISSLFFLQSFVGLNVTGKVDTDTLYNMLIPRCGVKDIIGHGAKTRKKR